METTFLPPLTLRLSVGDTGYDMSLESHGSFHMKCHMSGKTVVVLGAISWANHIFEYMYEQFFKFISCSTNYPHPSLISTELWRKDAANRQNVRQ